MGRPKKSKPVDANQALIQKILSLNGDDLAKLLAGLPLEEKQESTPETTKKQSPLNRSKNTRTRYDESGKADGTYTRSEPINIKTKHIDTGEDKKDKENSKLKKITKIIKSERDNGLVHVRCTSCNGVFDMSPILVPNKSTFLCNACIINKGRR